MPFRLLSNDTSGEMTWALAVTRDPGLLRENGTDFAITASSACTFAGGVNAKILFLGDAEGPLYSEYSQVVPQANRPRMYSSDCRFEGRFSTNGDVADLHLDHLDKFHKVPASSTFDLILGRSIICWCKPGEGACGLPTTDSAVGAKFLRRVWKLLSSTNRDAAAYLHGMPGVPNDPMFTFWYNAARFACEEGEADKSQIFPKGTGKGISKYLYYDGMDITLYRKADRLRCIRIKRVSTGLTVN
jgi:hypothetical protein